MPEPITFVLTSCDRLDLLARAMDSFREHNTYPIARFIIIDDSERQSVKHKIEERYGDFCDVILNPRNLGMFGSTDRAYQEVETELVFHCEDDWEFFRPGFVEDALDILQDPEILQVQMRDLATMPSLRVTDVFTTRDGVPYREVIPTERWGGYSTNPHVKRMSDYRKVGPGGYAQFVKERRVGLKFAEFGYRVALLERPAVRHIGEGRHFRDSNRGFLPVRKARWFLRRVFLR